MSGRTAGENTGSTLSFKSRASKIFKATSICFAWEILRGSNGRKRILSSEGGRPPKMRFRGWGVSNEVFGVCIFPFLE